MKRVEEYHQLAEEALKSAERDHDRQGEECQIARAAVYAELAKTAAHG